MQRRQDTLGAGGGPAGQPARGGASRRPRLLGPMRVRKKLIVLHTAFSLALAAILLLSVRPAISDVVARAEADETRVALDLLARAPELARRTDIAGVEFATGDSRTIGLADADARRARATPDEVVMTTTAAGWPRAVRWDAERGDFLSASARSSAARAGVLRLYALVVAAVVGVYVLIALTLEVFVLPRQVYRPIRRLLAADEAVQSGQREAELIPPASIPSDELGEIMRSRNESILKLRRQETALADALERLELVATDLKRKNHLLETARRNMADQDRLASLGMMSAGLAHELNTPLAVLKGCVEKLAEAPAHGVDPERAQLMLRVVNRLERLGESLLDFARVRPPSSEVFDVRAVVEEAWTLVRLDREARGVVFVNEIPPGTQVVGDSDRLTQVFVNLVRNAADALEGAGTITVVADRSVREGRPWLSITLNDTGPGIDPEVLARLFEPFTSTRLDSRGTGLGLAVAEGIVREHGGLILARNAHPGGAVFEVMLPVDGGKPEPSGAPEGTVARADSTVDRSGR